MSPDLEKAYGILRRDLESEEAIQAFEQAVRDVCLAATYSFLYLLDGSAEFTKHFGVQLIDAFTKEDLRPEDGTYVSEFSYYVDQREQREAGK